MFKHYSRNAINLQLCLNITSNSAQIRAMTDESGKPARKDKYIGIRVDEDLHSRASKRAKKDKRKLSEILRAWLRLYADEEVNAPVDAYLDKERKRAEKRPGKKDED